MSILQHAITNGKAKQNTVPLAAQQFGVGEELTDREYEVLRQIAWGRSYKRVASDLCISVKTVEYHRRQAMMRLGLSDREDVVRYALRSGWLH